MSKSFYLWSLSNNCRLIINPYGLGGRNLPYKNMNDQVAANRRYRRRKKELEKAIIGNLKEFEKTKIGA